MWSGLRGAKPQALAPFCPCSGVGRTRGRVLCDTGRTQDRLGSRRAWLGCGANAELPAPLATCEQRARAHAPSSSSGKGVAQWATGQCATKEGLCV